MSTDDSQPINKARLLEFSKALSALVNAYAPEEGLGGCIMGYGVGYMIGKDHSTESDIRDVFEKTLMLAGKTQFS